MSKGEKEHSVLNFELFNIPNFLPVHHKQFQSFHLMVDFFEYKYMFINL